MLVPHEPRGGLLRGPPLFLVAAGRSMVGAGEAWVAEGSDLGCNSCRLEGPKALPTVGARNGYGSSLFRRARRAEPGRRVLASSQAGGESALDQRVLSLPRSELGTAKQTRGTARGTTLGMARLLKNFWEVGP